jgi:diguanylate cyclase (GGDEF)-like protein/PAS domain S-box-containing protein
MVLLAFLAHAAVFLHGYSLVGRAVGMVVMIPILVGAHYFGVVGGVVCGALALPVNAALLTQFETTDFFSAYHILILLITTSFGAFAGIVARTSRKRRRSEDLLNVAFEAAQDGLWDYHIDTGAVYFSPRWFTMLGYKADEFAHTFENWVSILHPEDRESTLEEINRMIQQPRPQFSVSFRMREKNGGFKWILSRGKIVDVDREGRARRMVGVHSDITDLKKAEVDRVYLAYHDQLTELPNRRSFHERASLTLDQAQRSETDGLCAVLLVDLDNFKDVNDSFGHRLGDELLKEATRRLRAGLRRSDLLFRFGGDEFAMVLTNLHRATDAAVVADKLIERFAAPFELDGREVYTGLSAGISVYPRDGSDPFELIRNADTALNNAKLDRNTYRFYTQQMQSEAVVRIQMMAELRNALDREEFCLYYQPIVDGDGFVLGAEALIRWQAPDGRLRLPAEFIGVAEETGLIFPIGRWVLERATSDAARWIRATGREIPVSVNLSPRQLRHSSILEDIDYALRNSGLPGDLLNLELTEDTFLEMSDEIVERLQQFRVRGIGLSIDDFGTGYSSMSYLKRLPMDTIKIDRSFVIGLPGDEKDVSIVKAVTTMARGLGLSIIAEGVDSSLQVDFLTSLGCTMHQGFFFAHPMPSTEFLQMLPGDIADRA